MQIKDLSQKTYFKIGQAIVIFIIFFFLIKSLTANWNQVKSYSWELNYVYIFSSFPVVIFTYVLLVFIWKEILKKSGYDLSFKKMFKVWFVSNLGRYIPGKVWQFLGFIYLLEKEGVPKSRSFFISILAQSLSVLSGLFISVLFLRYDFYERIFARSFWLSFLFFFFLLWVLVIIFYPKLLDWILNLVLRILKRESVSLNLKTKSILFYFSSYFVCWLLFGFAFWMLVMGIIPVSFTSYFNLTGVFAGAFVLGFLAFFAPGGIGVREGIMVVFLSLYFPLPVATLISLLSRVWITLAEIFCFFVAMVWR